MLRELDGTVRYLPIREVALVQGFPQDYEVPGIRSRVMGVIGNAVAAGVASRLGTSLMAVRNAEPKTASAAGEVVASVPGKRTGEQYREARHAVAV